MGNTGSGTAGKRIIYGMSYIEQCEITGKIILTHFKDFSDKIKYLNFQKNGILAIMGSDDIVRKAMAMADKEVSHQRRRRSAKDDKEYVLLTHVQMHSK